jgi:Ca2+/Na+ antiporter
VVPLDWWPLTRDCLAYGVTVSLMICIIHDERVEWYEALTLVLLYIVYTAGNPCLAIMAEPSSITE